jgi:glycosyltransferase involved in cell wall biosynthesis
MTPTLTVIIPSYNEEDVLPATLELAQIAADAHHADGRGLVELIVVDNASTDATATVAAARGATVVHEPQAGIGRARNAGAGKAKSPRLFFLDADTSVPADVFIETSRALDRPHCFGGAISTDYRPRRRILVWYTRLWGVVAKIRRMAQGVAQFCTVEAFEILGGYDEERRMAEDTDFYWRLQHLAKARKGGHVTYVSETSVVPSTRRLDNWPVWKTLLLTNPVTTQLWQGSDRLWKGWRGDTVR